MKRFFAIFAIALLTFAVSMTTGWNPLATGIGLTAISLIPGGELGVALAGLQKEIWLEELKEGFYADDMWISELRDMSAFVENDIINLAEAGVNPDVLINNTTYPIATTERADGAIALELDNFDTENQELKHADKVELAYDKLSSIVFGHKQALRMTFMQKGAHAIAPAADGVFTPLLASSGADDGGGVLKAVTFDDYEDMETAFDEAEIPAEGRIVLMPANHKADLKKADKKLFKQIWDDKMINGFKIYAQASSRLPYYDGGVKVPFAAVLPGTAVVASVFFQKDEVMRASGDDVMFHGKAEDDPTNRKDVIGFAKRGLILPIRGKAVGAIYKDTLI